MVARTTALGLVLLTFAATSSCSTSATSPSSDTSSLPLASGPLASGPLASGPLASSGSALVAAASARPGPSSTPSASSSVAPPLADPDLAGAALHADASFLAAPDFRGRGSGTEDEARAGAWIAKKLDEAGVEKAFGARTVPFRYSRGSSANVLGLVAPPSSTKQGFVLVGAHYDHVGVRDGATYFGAEDNASGTAVVLGIARALVKRKTELDRPVIVAFFGAEEHGLHGSRAFVKGWKDGEHPISMMVNVDMIGRSLVDQPLLWLGARALGVLSDVDPDTAVGALLPAGDPSLKERVVAACEPEGVRAITADDLPPSLRPKVEEMSRGRGDHYPFELKGIPFVFFSSGEATEYHKPTDTADKLEPAVLERRARAILRFILAESRR
jgi:Zn-dependent M28 family amino/carboxypeptidase